jgi:hypothetical protein
MNSAIINFSKGDIVHKKEIGNEASLLLIDGSIIGVILNNHQLKDPSELYLLTHREYKSPDIVRDINQSYEFEICK